VFLLAARATRVAGAARGRLCTQVARLIVRVLHVALRQERLPMRQWKADTRNARSAVLSPQYSSKPVEAYDQP